MRAFIGFTDRNNTNQPAVELKLSEDEWLEIFHRGTVGGRMVSTVNVNHIEIPVKETAPSLA